MKGSVVRILISLFFIGLLCTLMRDELKPMVRILKGVEPGFLVWAVALYLVVGMSTLAKRFNIICGANGLEIGFLEAFQLTLIGIFFNNFLPTSVGGDLVKAYCASQKSKRRLESFSSVLIDRIFGLFTFVLLPSVTLIFVFKSVRSSVIAIVYASMAVALLAILFIFNRKVAEKFKCILNLFPHSHIADKIKKVYDSLHAFRNRRALLVLALALSLVGQVVAIWVIYLMALALKIQTGFFMLLLLVPIIHLVSMLPSLNGLGIREGAFVYFLGPLMGSDAALAVGILWLGLLFLLSLMGGLVYLFNSQYHFRLKDIQSATS